MVVRLLFIVFLSPKLGCETVRARGQPRRILRFALTNLSNIDAGVRHSWQSFGFVGWNVWALACVPLGAASLSG
jgi:hypothetical protein